MVETIQLLVGDYVFWAEIMEDKNLPAFRYTIFRGKFSGFKEDGRPIAENPNILDSSRQYRSHNEVYGAAVASFLQQIQKFQRDEQRCPHCGEHLHSGSGIEYDHNNGVYGILSK